MFKFALTEGLTRWQLATEETLLEGAMSRLGGVAQYGFLIYLVVWSFLVAAALMSACGVAAQAIFPVADDPSTGKIIYGSCLSIVGLVLVRLGGYRLFEKVMGVCIGLMFVTVVVSAALLMPSWSDFARGLFWPTIPLLDGDGLPWTIALMTALFGLAMVVLGSTIQVEGRGAALVIKLAARLGDELGPVGMWAFLLGAFGAVFSSLLGVWQSVPYLFADLWGRIRDRPAPPDRRADTSSPEYRWYLLGISLLPMIGLWVGFARMQKLYAIVGALFIPMLAIVLLLLNGRVAWVGERFRNRPLMSALLLIILVFFLTAGGLSVRRAFGG